MTAWLADMAIILTAVLAVLALGLTRWGGAR